MIRCFSVPRPRKRYNVYLVAGASGFLGDTNMKFSLKLQAGGILSGDKYGNFA